jgi:hypothetical protein
MYACLQLAGSTRLQHLRSSCLCVIDYIGRLTCFVISCMQARSKSVMLALVAMMAMLVSDAGGCAQLTPHQAKQPAVAESQQQSYHAQCSALAGVAVLAAICMHAADNASQAAVLLTHAAPQHEPTTVLWRKPD